MPEFLYLTEEDTIKAGVLDPKLCVDNAADCFTLLSQGDYLMGGPSEHEHGFRLCFPKEERFPGFPVNDGNDHRMTAMLGYAGGRFQTAGCKWICANMDNLKKVGVPRANSFFLLSNVDTGILECAMVGTLVSTMRSGAASAVGARYLAPDAKVVGLLGAGLMNRSVALCFKGEMPNLQEIKVYDILPDKCKAWCEALSKELGINVHPVSTPEEVYIGSDCVHLAQSNKVEVPDGLLKDGATLIVSSFADLAPELICKANIIMDQMKAHDIWWEHDRSMYVATFDVIKLIEAGKINRADVIDMGDIHSGAKAAPNNGKVNIFYWMGMPLMDIALAADLYHTALEKGIGTKLSLWEGMPAWA